MMRHTEIDLFEDGAFVADQTRVDQFTPDWVLDMHGLEREEEIPFDDRPTMEFRVIHVDGDTIDCPVPPIPHG